MNNKFKRTAKKCIAGVLALSLAGGVIYYDGFIQTEAQEKATLPGIETIVSKYTSTDDAYNILEVVPDRQYASIGFLVAGQEPVYEGRKLSEIPSSEEREEVMAQLKDNISAYNLGDALTVSDYKESEDGDKSLVVRGRFIEDEEGQYKYKMASTSYRMLTEANYTGQRFNRNSSFTAASSDADTASAKGERVNVDFSAIPTDGSDYLEITINTTSADGSTVVEKANAVSRYNLRNDKQLSNITVMDILGTDGSDKSADYVGVALYSKSSTGDSYSYYGYTALGSDIGKTDTYGADDIAAYALNRKNVTDGDASVPVALALDNAADTQGTIDESNSIYIVLPSGEQVCWMYYIADADNNTYYYQQNTELTDIGSVYIAEFMEVTSGDFYISSVQYADDGRYVMTDSYVPNDTGMYVIDGEKYIDVLWKGGAEASEFEADTRKACRFEPAAANDTGDDIIEINVKYSGGIDNAEWFKTNVLDLTEGECDSVNVRVTTLTLAELCELVQSPDKAATYGIALEDVDLVYLSGRGDYSTVLKDTRVASGLSDTILALAKMAYGISGTTVNISDRIPFIIDYDFYQNTNAELQAFVLYLLQAENENIASEELAGYTDGGRFVNYITGIRDTLMAKADTVSTEKLGQNVKFSSLGELLAGNVYLCKNAIVSSAFVSDKTDDVSKKMYAEVKENSSYENFIREQNNVSGTINEEITDATIVRYIISWTSKRGMLKSELKVLDVEPGGGYPEDTVLQTQIMNYINQPDYDKENIKITHMASAEFIGKIEDLNATYDLIYFGDNVDTFNTDTGKNTVYNDTSMNGLIYYHTGDKFSYDDESAEAKTRLQNDSLTYSDGYYYRGPGNDINSTRYAEVVDYIESGYAVVFADKFFKNADSDNVAVNTTTVDSESYFYKLMNFVLSKDGDGNFLYWNKNVYTESNLYDISLVGVSSSSATAAKSLQQSRQETFKKYLNLSKLTIQWESVGGEASKPTEYTYSTANKNDYDADHKDAAGNITKIQSSYTLLEGDELNYIFSLQSDSAVSADAVSYDCKLFLDSNADGRFTGDDVSVKLADNVTSEEIDNLNIYEYSGSAWNKVGQTDGHYTLSVDTIYKVSRKIPDGYVGVLPWELVIYNNNNTGIRISETGYTGIKGEEKTIKILQLTSDKRRKIRDSSYTVDANGKKITGATYRWVDNENWNLEEDSEVSLLLGEVKEITGIDVEITSISVNDLLEKIRTKTAVKKTANDSDYMTYCRDSAKAEFDEYNMIIVGFADNFQFGNTENEDAYGSKQKGNLAIAEALNEYINAGKSVLFTHDTSSYIESTEGGNVNLTAAIRTDKDTNETENVEVGDRIYTWYWGYEFNKTLRASLGLDRFGVTRLYYQKKLDETGDSYYENALNILNGYEYDTIYEPNSGSILDENNAGTELERKEGLTRFTTVRYMTNRLATLFANEGNDTSFYFPVNNKLLYNASFTSWDDKNKVYTSSSALNGNYAYSGSGSTLKVSQVNSGQITSYPYNIPDGMTISATHYQWLQPNMELDKDNDGKNDIVVWYCLSDLSNSGIEAKAANSIINDSSNIYSLIKNDVVNNYYIYTMGNVTYSGVGHSKPRSLFDSDGEPTYEKRLFINTMVAALKQTDTAPSLTFKDETGNKTDGVYIMYDSQNGMALSTSAGANKFSINFEASDTNMINGKEILIEFFTDAMPTDKNTVTINGIKMAPVTKNVTVKKVSDNSVAAVKDVAGGNYSQEIKDYFAGSECYSIQNGTEYTVSFDADDLGVFETKDGMLKIMNGASSSVLYARITTVYNGGSDKTDSTVEALAVHPAELFELR